MPAKVQKLGPGTLLLGNSADQLDVSCQITNAVLSPNKDTEDPTTVLCGDTIPGASTYNWQLSGALLVDVTAGGVVQWTWEHENRVVAFEFIPNNAAATSFAGQVVVDPLAIGGDTGQNMSQEFEWSCVGRPTPTFADPMARTYPGVQTIPSEKTWPTAMVDRGDSLTPGVEPSPGIVTTADTAQPNTEITDPA